MLSAEDKATIERFRGEMLTVRKDLRDVQLALRSDIERLEERVKVINIGAVPILICGVGGALALFRRFRRTRASAPDASRSDRQEAGRKTMRARSFLILSAITLVVSAAAAVVVVRQENPRSAVATAGPVLPGLVDRLGDVSAVVLRGGGETLTIHRIEGGWGVKERNDYPVSPDKVRDLVRSMVELEKAEAKTTQPDRYGSPRGRGRRRRRMPNRRKSFWRPRPARRWRR